MCLCTYPMFISGSKVCDKNFLVVRILIKSKDIPGVLMLWLYVVIHYIVFNDYNLRACGFTMDFRVHYVT